MVTISMHTYIETCVDSSYYPALSKLCLCCHLRPEDRGCKLCRGCLSGPHVRCACEELWTSTWLPSALGCRLVCWQPPSTDGLLWTSNIVECLHTLGCRMVCWQPPSTDGLLWTSAIVQCLHTLGAVIKLSASSSDLQHDKYQQKPQQL